MPEAVNVLQEFSGKRLYIWTPSADGRKSTPERAVWLSSATDRFNLNCDDNPIGIDGRARRVRKKSSNDLISAQECDASSHSLRRGSAGNVGAQKAIPISAQKNTLLPEPETFEQKRITDPRVLEYAKGLLSGIPSGTVMDWKKINSRQ